jgi:hypothetical protein
MAQTRSFWKNGVMGFFDEDNNSDYRTGVWADCPLLAIEADPSLAYVYMEDFLQFEAITDADPPTSASWTWTQGANTNGGAAIIAGAGGILEIDCESTTQHEGMHAQLAVAPFKLAANKDLWFECRVMVTDTYDKCEFFAGISKLDTTLMKNDGDLDTGSDYVGFGVETTLAGVTSFYICKDAAELSDSMGTTGTLPEADWIRLGFHVDGTTGIHAFIDGDEQTLTNVVYTGIPTTDALSPIFVCQTDGTNDPLLAVDWVRCVQLR